MSELQSRPYPRGGILVKETDGGVRCMNGKIHPPQGGSGENPRTLWWGEWVSGAQILGFFPTYFGFLSGGKSQLFEQFQHFSRDFCIKLCTFLLQENQIRCQYQIWEWHFEKSRPKFGESNFKDQLDIDRRHSGPFEPKLQ